MQQKDEDKLDRSDQIYAWIPKRKNFGWVAADSLPNWRASINQFVEDVREYMKFKSTSDETIDRNRYKKCTLFELEDFGMAEFSQLTNRSFHQQYQSEHLLFNLFQILFYQGVMFVHNQYNNAIKNSDTQQFSLEILLIELKEFQETAIQLAEIFLSGKIYKNQLNHQVFSLTTLRILNVIKKTDIWAKFNQINAIYSRWQFQVDYHIKGKVYLFDSCDPLIQAIDTLQKILSNPNTNTMIFVVVKLLNEQFTPSQDSMGNTHLVPTDIFPDDPVLLGREMVSLLPQAPFIFFKNTSPQVAVTLPCGNIAYNLNYFPPCNNQNSEPLIRVAQYLLVTFHEINHVKRLVKVNKCKYLIRTPENVSRFDTDGKVWKDKEIKEAGLFFERTVFGFHIAEIFGCLSVETCQLVLTPSEWEGEMLNIISSLKHDLQMKVKTRVVGKSFSNEISQNWCGRLQFEPSDFMTCKEIQEKLQQQMEQQQTYE